MSDVDAVLFDLYDTLVWTEWDGLASGLADRLGVPAERVIAAYEDLRLRRDGGEFPDPGSVLAAVVEYCGLEPHASLVDELTAWEAGMLVERVILYADVLPVLRRLRAEGMRTSVVSNCSPSTRPVVDRLDLPKETDVVVLSCEVGVVKPAAAIYRQALEALEVPAERSVFVDDRTDYLDGAASLGIRTFRVMRSPERGEESEGTHRSVTDLGELLERLP